VRLRGRFTLWFAVATLLPIAVAAIVTRFVLVRSYRETYEASRVAVEQATRLEVQRLSEDVEAAVRAMADREYPLVGGLLRELVKDGGRLGAATIKGAARQAAQEMDGFRLDVLTITGPGDEVLVAPHDRAATGDVDPAPTARAHQLAGKAFFARDKVMTGKGLETVVVAAAAQTARDGDQQVAVLAGRRVTDDLLRRVRRAGNIDARLVGADGTVILPPAERHWQEWTATPAIRVPLTGADGTPFAWLEVAVSDDGLDSVLARVTLVSAVLAAAALAITILLGLWIARRMTRDLDRLAVGAQAAARGDLDHRVPVSAKDEVGEVAAAFNLMMEDLRGAKERLVIAERIAAWQEIARRLAHEIKNPLTPIQMAMDTLRKTWRKKHPSFDEILEESTATVLEEARRLGRIVSEFSDFARMPKPELGPADLSEVVDGALALYSGAAQVDRRLAEGLPKIEVDRDQIIQVLLNLVENARDAVASRPEPDGGRIVVSTRIGDAGDRIELAVEDNGPGVSPELKEKVFTPYFTTKQGKGGTGLGLAIVHRIISDHGGRISVGDAPGGGARFVVELPRERGAPLLASRLTQSDGPRLTPARPLPTTSRPG
jgi:signal transduction histidine kinase